MPAYTHTQPAQPTTLAHYLMAAVETMGRDTERLQAAFGRVNRSPLGACAFATTGFPIAREYTAELLGFEGLQSNSYGAIAAVDYVTEAASAVAVTMVNLGKFVQDLLLWCTEEFGFLRLQEGYVQISSIMPQKRNPVSLEHTRILASKAFGQAQAVLTCTHNTPFGDIVDSEDDLQPLVFSAFTDAQRALRLFAGLMELAEFQRERLRQQAHHGFLTATEVADTLVRREKIDFRHAHQLVSSAIQTVGADYSPERMAEHLQRLAPQLLGHPLETSSQELLRAQDPENFVRIRSIVGGPAPSAVSAEIERARHEISETSAWLEQKRALLDAYPQRLRAEAARLEKHSS
jgi:argininosuccinate lyase